MRGTAERMRLEPDLSSANPGPDEDGLARHWALTPRPGTFPAAWRKALGPAGSRPRRALWEIALAFAMRDALRSGDLFLAASRRHVSFWNLVTGERRWAEAKENAYGRLPVSYRRGLRALRDRQPGALPADVRPDPPDGGWRPAGRGEGGGESRAGGAERGHPARRRNGRLRAIADRCGGVELAALSAWSMVHGLTMLLTDRMAVADARSVLRDNVLEGVARTLLAGLRSR